MICNLTSAWVDLVRAAENYDATLAAAPIPAGAGAVLGRTRKGQRIEQLRGNLSGIRYPGTIAAAVSRCKIAVRSTYSV